MNIERKFKMFSTKEWIQFLQYKLSQEREKEMEVQMTKEAFLKEAIETIGDKENRAVSFQSMTHLISEVQQYTGVSESKISRSKESIDYDVTAPINWKLIGVVSAGIALLCLLVFGVYALIHRLSNSPEQEQTMLEAESVSSIQSYADSSGMPMEIIPINTNKRLVDTTPAKPAVKTNPYPSASMPAKSGSTAANTGEESENTVLKNNTSNTSNSNGASQRERDLFNQAQEIFKQGNREEAKRILRELKSYDNPMKSQAETILKNMEN